MSMGTAVLQYLDFDFSEDEHGLGSFDAMAAVLPAQVPALHAELTRVLAWACGAFSKGPLDEGYDWDYDLQLAEDSAALRVRFDGPVPAPEQRYWRGPVMSQFDGSSWSRANLPGQAATPRDSVAQWRYVIDYEPTDKRQLVALDLPLAAPAGSHLDGQYGLRSERPLTGLTRWALASSPAQASARRPARVARSEVLTWEMRRALMPVRG